MHFLVIAFDDSANGTAARRLAARSEHHARLRSLAERGQVSDGGVLLADDGSVMGSVLVCEFPDRAALDRCLADDVYSREGVWEDLRVLDMRRLDPVTLGAARAS
jgi:uncharacterized protein YciI